MGRSCPRRKACKLPFFHGKNVGFLVPCEGSTYFLGGWGDIEREGGIVGVLLGGSLRSPWLLQIICDTRCWINERMQQVTVDDSVVFEVGKHMISGAWLDLVHIKKITKHVPRLFSSVNQRKADAYMFHALPSKRTYLRQILHLQWRKLAMTQSSVPNFTLLVTHELL